MNYLVFRLYGPMASWGEVAVGESRHSAVYPSKSAVLGLLGAALGIRREQSDLLANLFEHYTLGVKLLSGGDLLRDYHTAQAPDSVGKFQYRSRRDEVVTGRDRLGTVLSSREYRTDAQAVVAIRAHEGANWSFEQLTAALQKPKFHLYLGRKSCPLAAPLATKVIVADGFRQALDGYVVEDLLMDQPDWACDQRWLPRAALTHYYWEGQADDFSPADDFFRPAAVQQLKRRDQPASRSRWQFQPRTENLWIQPQGEPR